MQRDTIRRQLRSLAAGARRQIAGVRVARPGVAELYDVAGLGAAWLLDLDRAEQTIRDAGAARAAAPPASEVRRVA